MKNALSAHRTGDEMDISRFTASFFSDSSLFAKHAAIRRRA
jgi:hypothetical protein